MLYRLKRRRRHRGFVTRYFLCFQENSGKKSNRKLLAVFAINSVEFRL